MAEKPPARDESSSIAAQLARMHLWHFQAVRDVLFVAAIVGVFWLGYALRAVTVPLLVALLLAYLFEPLVARLSRHPRVSRPMVVGSILCSLVLLVVLVLAIAIPPTIHQTGQFISAVTSGKVRDNLAQIEEHLPDPAREPIHDALNLLLGKPTDLSGETATQPTDSTQTATESDESGAGSEAEQGADQSRNATDSALSPSASASSLLRIARGGVEAIIALIGRVVAIGLLAFLIPFYFFFFSVSYPGVVAFGRSLVPERNKTRVIDLARKMDRAVAGFVRGRIVIALIMGAMLAIGWMFCGVPYSIPLGLVVGFFGIVPYLSGVGIPLAVALLVIEQLGLAPDDRMSWWFIILAPTVVYLIVQLVETYVLTPTIAGKATNLDPVTILVAVLAGGSVLGVYGMLLAIPLAACAKILITDVLWPRIRAWTEGRAEDPLPLERD